ncbi:hypothetical protein HK097_011516 [Rhizophlyctis rosea]|uniref:Protein kinase domain-containing protein n=1 Tax=Rhizophlyctis rosea TaxID=64517 RepID=A0AAD5X311_9FUNG|nr:hypothetical protein HK097_011516 [Rhizophlyctis rosea]
MAEPITESSSTTEVYDFLDHFSRTFGFEFEVPVSQVWKKDGGGNGLVLLQQTSESLEETFGKRFGGHLHRTLHPQRPVLQRILTPTTATRPKPSSTSSATSPPASHIPPLEPTKTEKGIEIFNVMNIDDAYFLRRMGGRPKIDTLWDRVRNIQIPPRGMTELRDYQAVLASLIAAIFPVRTDMTFKSNATPDVPNRGRPDISLIAKGYPFMWKHVAGTIELQNDFSERNNTNYHIALSQVHQSAHLVLLMDPERPQVISAVTDLREIQFLIISFNKQKYMWEYIATNCHPLFPDTRPWQPTTGFQLLAGYLGLQSHDFPLPLYTPAAVKTATKSFQILSYVDLGGSSTVYHVADEQGADYAAKVHWGDRKEQFATEIKTLLHLTTSGDPHPKLPVLVDYTVDTIVISPLGVPVRQYLATPGGPSRSLTIVLDILSALRYIHQRGVFHGDVRPANIVVAGTSGVLVDFGNACFGECRRRSRWHQGLRGTVTFASDRMLLEAGDPYGQGYQCSAADDLESLIYVGVALTLGTDAWRDFRDPMEACSTRGRHRRFWKSEFQAALELLSHGVDDGTYDALRELLEQAMTPPPSREPSDVDMVPLD